MATTRVRHVVLFPFPGQGHLAGFLAIARLLRSELPDATLTLVSTPRNVAALRAFSAAADESLSLSFHALPFVPSEHGLPAGCESCSSLPVQAFINLFEAFESLEPAFDAYISGLREDEADVCVIADGFVAWTVNAARRHGCAHGIFLSCGAFGIAVYHALWKKMPGLPFGPDGTLHLADEHPGVAAFHRSQLSPAFLYDGDMRDRWTAYYHRTIRLGYRTDAVLVNAVSEVEPTGLAMVRRALGGKIPVWPIGPLVRGQDLSEADDGVLRWMDSQPPASVVYIAFGSQNTIQPEQMMELASALESTGRPFVWAIRPPIGFDIGGEFWDEWLPEGFEARARASKRRPRPGMGAASLSRGVPIIGWPLGAEQFYNVRMLAEEWGVCVELARGNMESSVDAVKRSNVAEVLETVMGETAESVAMRRRVAEVQKMLKAAWAADGGSSRTALQEFLTAVRLQ
ncbi:hypothetical protein PR202_ga12684 [Eleusine coracana subsp. coracana]|uniref:Glycosyltransferase N-terminal domain-containing protein n=1 Tax=Eleusine coracana subsp. coracana TaxID=191504 RepID=A0AAV5CCW1_ELECO|nr:hypothetical protein QOZ80_3AG0225610 [Eleusine coracana subsp. coracana]GJM95897.1 hypothetical protein PR202_ga12684 [Eleusine coracana subsp. coracana]